MIDAIFYTHRKRSNSTLQPTGGTKHEIVLKDNCGVLNPVIELFTSNPAAYNYAYIPAFSRYYYVTEWSYFKGVWTANLSVDVLASYKSYIGSENLYVLRSSVEWDGNINDSFYPVIKHDITSNVLLSPFSADGIIVMAIAGQEGGIVYGYCAESDLPDFVKAIFEGAINGADTGIFTQSLYKTFTNPAQYIKNSFWFPSNCVRAGNTVNIKAGWWEISQPLTGVSADALGVPIFTVDLAIPKHPQIEQRGGFLQRSPWSLYKLTFPGFGEIPLNSETLFDVDSITCYVYVDPYTGAGRLDIHANVSGTSAPTLILSVPGQIGVNYGLSGNVYNTSGVIGGISSIAGGVAAAAATAGTGGAAAVAGLTMAAAGSAAGINSIAETAMPEIFSQGSMGAITMLRQRVTLLSKFAIVADDDIQHHGRPLCKKCVISSLGGFVQVLDGDIKAPCTESENTSIQSYLEGGIYFE